MYRPCYFTDTTQICIFQRNFTYLPYFRWRHQKIDDVTGNIYASYEPMRFRKPTRNRVKELIFMRTLYKADTSLKRSLLLGTNGVRFIEIPLYNICSTVYTGRKPVIIDMKICVYDNFGMGAANFPMSCDTWLNRCWYHSAGQLVFPCAQAC